MLIIIEGADGSGKTTLAHGLCAALSTDKRICAYFREPASVEDESGGTGPWVREALRGRKPTDWPPETWICAFVTAMFQQDVVVREALRQKRDVVIDRRELSTVTYQCGLTGRQDLVKFVSLATAKLVQPDVIFLLDGSSRILAQRSSSHKDQCAFAPSLRLRQAYLWAEIVWKRERSRVEIIRIDADQSAERVLSAVLAICRGIKRRRR